MIKILEQFIQGRLNHDGCEDGIFHSDCFVVLVDGATYSQNNRLEETPGQIIKHLILRVFEDIRPNLYITEIIELINERIARVYSSNSDIPPDSLSATAVVYSAHFNEVWIIGDCQAIVNSRHYYTNNRIEVVLSELRAIVLHSYQLRGFSLDSLLKNDLGRVAIEPFLRLQNDFQNTRNNPYSYTCINGKPIYKNQIKIISVRKKYVTFSSDGYPKIYSNLRRTEDYLKQVLDNDPLMFIQYQATKGMLHDLESYDDRSYIRFQVGP